MSAYSFFAKRYWVSAPRICVVTTMHREGYERYGQGMLQSFDKHWSKDIRMLVLTEGFGVDQCYPSIETCDLETEAPGLLDFKLRNRERQRLELESRQTIVAPELLFKWEAIRFANKVFAILAAVKYAEAKNCSHLVWLDADVVTFASVDRPFLLPLMPKDVSISYLGRDRMHSECGFVIYNLKNRWTKEFFALWEDLYRTDRVFDLPEFHDSFTFDVIRTQLENLGMKNLNISKLRDSKVSRMSHPFVNSILGEKMDHLKGDRKGAGRSSDSDLKVTRNEKYWGGNS